MKRVLSRVLPKKGQPIALDPSEAQHLVKVLRARPGDPVEVIDGSGGSVLGKLLMRGKDPWIELDDSQVVAAAVDLLPIHLLIAHLKSDAMEWLVEKAVELGAASITPLFTDHTVVKLGRKTPDEFRQRLQKTADQALKQCGRKTRLEVHQPLQGLSVKSEAHELTFFCDDSSRTQLPSLSAALNSALNSQRSHPSRINLVIGPEGGWSAKELSEIRTQSWTSVSLGPIVLRAETAALLGLCVATSWWRELAS